MCYIAGNSLHLAVTAVVGQHWRLTVHCYPLTSQILQCSLPTQRFRRATVSLLDVMWPRSNQCALLGRNYQLYNNCLWLPKGSQWQNLASSQGMQFILTQMQCLQMADFRKFLITIFRASVQKTFRITRKVYTWMKTERTSAERVVLAERDLYKQSRAQALDSLLPVHTVWRFSSYKTND